MTTGIATSLGRIAFKLREETVASVKVQFTVPPQGEQVPETLGTVERYPRRLYPSGEEENPWTCGGQPHQVPGLLLKSPTPRFQGYKDKSSATRSQRPTQTRGRGTETGAPEKESRALEDP